MEVIQVQNLWKRFRLDSGRAGTLRELIPQFLRREERREFWALRGVSFQVGRGETVGIMGPNASGKSTLLKVLTGVLHPDRGRVRVWGRVCPLIELGAGFHPDLSGRDNLYLNGIILGLTRRDIEGKLPQIVDFAGLDGFLDTPLKHYSTGMQMRLAFSVAAHAEPDILMVDEVLAVGDEAFQRKCLEKLKEFRRQGGTVIFVSHHRELVYSFSDRVLHLEAGELKAVDELGGMSLGATH